jgi:hypothetical protein
MNTYDNKIKCSKCGVYLYSDEVLRQDKLGIPREKQICDECPGPDE